MPLIPAPGLVGWGKLGKSAVPSLTDQPLPNSRCGHLAQRDLHLRFSDVEVTVVRP